MWLLGGAAVNYMLTYALRSGSLSFHEFQPFFSKMINVVLRHILLF